MLVKYRYSDVYKRPVCEIFFTVKNSEQAVDTLDFAQHIVSKGWAWYRTEQKNTKANSLMKKIQAYANWQKMGYEDLMTHIFTHTTKKFRFFIDVFYLKNNVRVMTKITF